MWRGVGHRPRVPGRTSEEMSAICRDGPASSQSCVRARSRWTTSVAAVRTMIGAKPSPSTGTRVRAERAPRRCPTMFERHERPASRGPVMRRRGLEPPPGYPGPGPQPGAAKCRSVQIVQERPDCAGRVDDMDASDDPDVAADVATLLSRYERIAARPRQQIAEHRSPVVVGELHRMRSTTGRRSSGGELP